MKSRFASVALFALCLTFAVAAGAQQIYNDGPINGQVDGWTINYGFVVGDSFTVSTGTSTITGLSFGAWLDPGDVLESVDVSLTSEGGGGQVYFNGVVSFTASSCFINMYGFNVCDETGSFNGPTLPNGTYWVNLQNALVNDGDPVYWDENSGIGCTSPGCPSQTFIEEGTIPAESFTILGTSSGTGSVPEPGTMALFSGAALGVIAMMRRKWL
jgi:hypothetical protein